MSSTWLPGGLVGEALRFGAAALVAGVLFLAAARLLRLDELGEIRRALPWFRKG